MKDAATIAGYAKSKIMSINFVIKGLQDKKNRKKRST